MMHEEKAGRKKRALDELRELSITVMYIWVLLSVFTLHREIILANYHIKFLADEMSFGELGAQPSVQKPTRFARASRSESNVYFSIQLGNSSRRIGCQVSRKL